jgi:hypothetical protein
MGFWFRPSAMARRNLPADVADVGSAKVKTLPRNVSIVEHVLPAGPARPAWVCVATTAEGPEDLLPRLCTATFLFAQQ